MWRRNHPTFDRFSNVRMCDSENEHSHTHNTQKKRTYVHLSSRWEIYKIANDLEIVYR